MIFKETYHFWAAQAVLPCHCWALPCHPVAHGAAASVDRSAEYCHPDPSDHPVPWDLLVDHRDQSGAARFRCPCSLAQCHPLEQSRVPCSYHLRLVQTWNDLGPSDCLDQHLASSYRSLIRETGKLRLASDLRKSLRKVPCHEWDCGSPSNYQESGRPWT